MADSRISLIDQLSDQLALLVVKTKNDIRSNLGSTNVVAETILCGLLNRMYDWNLVNANSISQNYPGVDLIDERNNIAVQVTSTCTKAKIQNTLEKVGKLGVTFARLIILLISSETPGPTLRTCTDPSYHGNMEVWSIPDILRTAKELDMDKLKKLTAYMDDELGTGWRQEKWLDLPPASALPPTGFVGREGELAEIRSLFAQGDPEVVLTGLGGMGKTELAVRFGQNHPGLVYFVRFDTNFTRTLANMVHSIRPRLVEEELRLEESILVKKVLTILERSSPDDLLIIDNADSDTGVLADLLKDPGYQHIRKLPLKLLLTTRSAADRSICVAPMPEEPLFQIFRNHGASLTEKQMCELIDAVNGHTLTIDLIARTLADNWVPVSVQEMLDAVRNSTLSEEDFPEVGTDYNGDLEQLHIYQRLKGVFQVAGIPPLEQQILRCATLLPAAGMDVRLFRDALTPELRRLFPGLGRRGWLSAANRLLTIHPVVRLVCRTELTPTDTDCAPFLDSLWTRYAPAQYRPDHYAQMAELFTLAHDRLNSPHCRWLNYSGILLTELNQYQQLHALYYTRLPALETALPPNSTDLATSYNYYGLSLNQLGRYSDALAYAQKALSIQQAELPADCVELAYSYNNVGCAQGCLGDFRTALEYKLKALAILRNVLSLDHPDLAKSYNHVGSTYNDLGLHHKALEYNQMALDICKRALSPEHPLLASAYDSAGLTLNHLGHYQQALEYRQRALNIRQTVLPPDHPDLASSYHSIGHSYGELGLHHDALEYHRKALAIREKALPPDHPNFASSYLSIGYSYRELGRYHNALEYHQKALAIQENAMPPDHPDLAFSYGHIAGAYSALGKHHHALKYYQKALVIREKALPPEHPDLATAYNDVGYAYNHLGIHQKALEYQQKALAIREKILLPEHPALAMAYNNLGGTYHYMGDHQKALEYHQKALYIREKSLPPDHSDLAMSYNNVGCTYGNLGNHRKELEYQQKALAICEKALPLDHPDLALSCSNIAWTYYELGDFPSAVRFMDRAAEIIGRSSLPKTHPQQINYPKWAAELRQKADFQRKLLTQSPDLPQPPFPFPKK